MGSQKFFMEQLYLLLFILPLLVYPHGEVEGTVGLLVNDTIVLCGGARYDDLGWYKDCFRLVSDELTGRLNWKFFPSMKHERGWAESVLLKDGSWLVLMGEGPC